MPENEGKNLFIIAHAFPPSGGAGVRRVLKVVRYLSQWGWNIIVLAPRRGEHFAYPYDPSLLDEIAPTVQVVECFTPEQWTMTKAVAAGEGAHTQAPDSLGFTAAYKRLYGSVGGLLAVPESAITWLPFAVWRGWNLIRKHRVDVLLATGPPFSALLVGTALKRLSGKPLVVEFRDAWIAEPARVYENRWRWRLEKKQESWVVHTSDYVVSVTEGVTQDFAQRYSESVEPDKFVTIPNGYDQFDFAVSKDRNGAKPQSDAGFNIVYTGTLGGVRNPKFFLQAVQKMLTQRPQLRSQLNIRFVGRCGRFADGSTIEEYVQTYGLEDIVDLVGFVSRGESLWYQRKADLLLLLVGVVSASEAKCYGLSAKVFDYTLAGKPVLAVAEDGATADYVKASGIGEVVSHHDEAGMITAIERALAGELHYSPQPAVIGEYDYAALMHGLESVLISSCTR
jgi:glycosyltransferase involved in cell wall biosynthesis